MEEITAIKYNVPRECKRVTIEREGTQVLVIFEPAPMPTREEFLCELTGENEEIARVGEFAIMWEETKRDKAIVSRVLDVKNMHGRIVYQATTVALYDNAIRFRNYDQYKRVLGWDRKSD